MNSHRRPTFADWRAGIIVGAVSGTLLLGVGGRIGMRGIAVAQGQPAAFTIDGSIIVALLGSASGAVIALIFLASRAAFPAQRVGRTLCFWTVLGLLVWRGLNPVSALNLSIFAPLFVLHGALLTAYWCRVRHRVDN
jgi:hypothetical protein